MRTTLLLNSIILLFSLLSCSFFTSSQSAFQFKNYSISDGLSQSSVLTIIQDDNYSLWIGTQDGLNKFDGTTFEVFTPDNVDGLKSSYISSSIKLNDGTLWFGTSNGLTRYNPKTEDFKTYNFNKNEILHIESIVADLDENIWISTVSKGVIKFDRKTEKFRRMERLFPTRRTKDIFVSSEGAIFVFSEDKGVYYALNENEVAKKINFSTDKKRPLLITNISQIDPKKVLFGTNQGVFVFDIVTETIGRDYSHFSQEFNRLTINTILSASENQKVVGTANNGLYTIDKDGVVSNSAQDIFQKNALMFNEINCLYQDFSGTIWVGTGRGLSSFDPENKGFLGIGPSGNMENGIPSRNVWCFAEDKAGAVTYIGTDLGVSKLNNRTKKFTQYNKKKTVNTTGESSETTVLDIYPINDDLLLVACVDGIYELKIQTDNSYSFERISFIDPLVAERHRRTYCIEKYKENKFFLATKGGVLLIDFDTKETIVFEHNPKEKEATIKPGVCRLIFKNSKGEFYFTTSSGGLNKLYEGNGKLTIKPYVKNDIFERNLGTYITCIYESDEDEYWLGTLGGGVVYWNDLTNSLKRISKKQGLPNNVVYGIVEDNNHNLWISTNKGLSCYNIKQNKIVNYSEVDGLLSNEFNSGAYMKSKSGLLYFGGISGFNYFDPTAITSFNYRVDVIITGFKFEKDWLKPNTENSPLVKPISKTNVLELSYKQRSFTFRFQPSNFSNPERVNYKYELKGSDEGEIFLGNTNHLRFNALSSGSYKLFIYARIGEGEWIGQPAIINIEIASPFWATWWFWLILSVLLFVIVRFSVRKRIDYERRNQVKLEMKIAQRTKEIRSQNLKIEKQKKLIEEEKEKVEHQQELLKIEKEKSEKLLKNVIPESTVQELLSKGTARARAYKKVSVLFTDFVGFTKIADVMDPTDLVKQLDVYFRVFDQIIVNNNLEKIKTIGDAYMCAGGVPVRNNTNPIDTCLAGLQIQHYMDGLKKEAKNNDFWTLRLGINTGEVTAGVIGSERLAYDIWGATVNQAQRMEMLGEPGKVTITEYTFAHIEPYFECAYKGQVQTKSRGIIEMYQVLRIKPELSVNGEGIYPNERFHQIVNLHHYSSINYYKAERYVMALLEKNLSDKLHYHSVAHTDDVVRAVERLALSENVTDEGLFLLKTAASYHDAGFVEQYDKNEPIGARLATEILPKYGYTEEHINKIRELIFVTAIPHAPKNKLEEIICDADLDYLGRDDFHEIADRLRRELKEHGKIDSDRKWDEIQVSFLTQHRYFTETAISTRREKKLKNLEEIKQRLLKDEYKD